MHASMNSEKIYKGVWPVLVTPFKENGEIDYRCYIELLDWYISSGVSGIFSVCGSSEMFELVEEERLSLARLAVERCKGKVPVVATGSFGKDIESHRVFCHKLADVGVDSVILLLPDFCRNESETLDYLLGMSESLPCDVGVYECPGMGIGRLSPESVKLLAETNRFGPYKETSCDVSTISEKVRACSGTRLSILQANTPFMVEALEVGASGLMGISVNVVPSLAVDVYRDFTAGGSVDSSHQLLCLADALLRLCYPVSAKIMLSQLGFDINVKTRVKHCNVSKELRKLIEVGFGYLMKNMSSDFAISHDNL